VPGDPDSELVTFDEGSRVTRPEDDDTATVVGDEIPASELQNAGLIARGRKIGRYVVVDKLGSGAMGTVYRAYDPELDRGIALKLVEIRTAQHSTPAEIRARIMREAQAIARVQHPNVVQVFDVGEIEHAVWVAMEFVDGLTLRNWLEDKTRSFAEILHTFVCAGEGLAAAHRADIVHRDFKPDNVMIGHDGRVRVLDFGLARAVSGPTTREGPSIALEELQELEELQSVSREAAALEASLTAHGVVMGTPAYMAPEQHVGKPTSAAADQFAFCVTLWEAVYGQRPFRGDTHAAIAFAATRGKVAPPPSDRGVPKWLHTLLLRGLAPRPDERFADMKAVVAALETDPARRRRRIAIVTGIAALGVVAAVARTTADPVEPCTSAAEHFDRVWDDARRTTVREAFVATGLGFANDAYDSATAVLDDWRERWISTHSEACRATHVHREQSAERLDLRMACLQHHLTEFEALVGVLETATAEVVTGAVDATGRLPSLLTCDDIDYLTARVPPPADPERAEQLDTLRAALATVTARVNAGAFTDRLAELDALETEVLALDYPPLSAHFFRLRGLVQTAVGDPIAGRTAWERSFALWLRSGDTREAALAATKLVHIIGHKLSKREDATRWIPIAQELAQGTGDPDTVLASLWSAEATMLSMHGDWTGSIELEKKVIAFWEKRDNSRPSLAVAYGNHGNAEMMRGNLDVAAQLLRKALTLTQATYGARHPEVGATRAQLARVLSTARRFDEARPMFEEAIEILVEAEGEGSTRVASAMDGFGRVLRQQGELDAAVAMHRKALAAWRTAVGEDHPDVGVSLMHIGYTLAAKEDWAEAGKVFDEAEAVLRRGIGDDHPQLIYVANSRAAMLLELGRPADAIPIVERALTLDAVEQVDPTLVAETQFILAQALWHAERDRPRAMDLANKARDAYAAGSEMWAAELEEIETWLAARPAQ